MPLTHSYANMGPDNLCKIPATKKNINMTLLSPTSLLLLLVLGAVIIAPSQVACVAATDNVDIKANTSGLTVAVQATETVTARSNITEIESTDATAVRVVSGYGIAPTLDFAEQKKTTTTVTDAVIHSSAVHNGHQNGMLLMAMLLDNKTNIESKDTKPALAIFDFNPEDIQDLDGNDFYSVDSSNSSTEADNAVGETTADHHMKAMGEERDPSSTDDLNEETLWTLPENPLTMPLVMMTNGQALPGAAMGSGITEVTPTTTSEAESEAGNIYKVKLKRRTESKKRDHHLSIASQMNVLGNEVTTIAQFQTLISMFDHWKWNEGAIAEQVSKPCGQDMTTYLTSLKAGQLWALKGE